MRPEVISGASDDGWHSFWKQSANHPSPEVCPKSLFQLQLRQFPKVAGKFLLRSEFREPRFGASANVSDPFPWRLDNLPALECLGDVSLAEPKFSRDAVVSETDSVQAFSAAHDGIWDMVSDIWDVHVWAIACW